MSSKWIFLYFIVICFSAIAYGLSGDGHNFSENQCTQCHYDTADAPLRFKPEMTGACNACHGQLEEKKSHPSDIYPSISIPEDMPLLEGKVTCVTCHYAHPKANIQIFVKNHYYLRRNVTGVFFCLECHSVDNEGHIVFENIHVSTYRVTDRTTRIDQTSLQCIECHDSHMKDSSNALGAGVWNHFRRQFNHTIGVSYKDMSIRNIKKFKPIDAMSEEMRFYDGKVGCGTCHNIYSREKNMLVINNAGGRLCLQCHNK